MVCLGILFIIPTSFFEQGHSICLFKTILGRECWGCGMTRAFSCVVHGNLHKALGYNKLVIIVFPLIVCLCVRSCIKGKAIQI